MSTAHAASLSDAFSLGFLPGVLGPPLVNRDIAEKLPPQSVSAELKHALEFGNKALQLSQLRADKAYKTLAEKIGQLGITRAERPATAQSFEAWLFDLRPTLRRVLSPDAGALAAYDAGVAAADLHLALWVLRHLIYLRSASPEHALLTKAAGNVARSLGAASQRLREALRQAPLATATAELSQQLEVLFAQPPELAEARTTEAFKTYGDWAFKVSQAVDEIAPALVRADPALDAAKQNRD